MKLSSLKMPPSPSAKSSSGMSFMPKGSTLSKNVKRVKEEPVQPEKSSILHKNKSYETSESDGSKYSYEDSADDMDHEANEKNMHGSHRSFLSPTHSAYDSPDAMDVNTLVQLSRYPPGYDASTKKSPLHTLKEQDRQTPSLGLRKTMQPTSLKPLQPAAKKKSSPKRRTKNRRLSNAAKYETDDSDKAAELEEQQRMMLKSIRKEWESMQEDFEMEEKAKYEKMLADSVQKFEEEEKLIKKQHSDQILKLKNDLEDKIIQEQNLAVKTLSQIKESNDLKYKKEEENYSHKLNALIEEHNAEFSKMTEQNESEINEKKVLLDKEMEKEIEMYKTLQENKFKELKDSYSVQLELIEKAHKDKLTEINSLHSKEIDAAENQVNGNVYKEDNQLKDLQSKIDESQELLEQKKKELEELSENLNDLASKIKTENEVLSKLKEEVSKSQSHYEEIQDEVDKTEADLDLLRTEKSALISELSILKENVSKEKSKLQSKEKTLKTNMNHKKEFESKAINTELQVMFSQNTQTLVNCEDFSCNTYQEKCNVSSQISEVLLDTFDKCCQVNLPENVSLNIEQITPLEFLSHNDQDVAKIRTLINQTLESAISSVTNKMDEKIKAIEKHIGSLSVPANHENKPSITIAQNVSKPVYNLEEQITAGNYDFNFPQVTNVHDAHLMNASHPKHSLTSSHKTCSCVQGDLNSCDIMQDVKNSIYRLNDILGESFMPSISNSDIVPRISQPLLNYASPLDTFYNQFRQIQEKHRVINLKHKCQNESNKQNEIKNLMPSGTNQLRNIFKAKDYSKPNNINSSNLYAIDYEDDPIVRARNLVLIEKARSWKQKQLLNSSISQTDCATSSLSDYSTSSRTSTKFGEISPFLNFEPDPETDYNSWMLRLNSLQKRLRRHKFT